MLTTKWRLGLAISLLLAPAAAIIQGDRATAVEQNGTYVVISPRSSSAWITSPGRFHDGVSCSDWEKYDSPQFDDGTCIKAGLISGDWAMDINGSDNNSVWIDINPAGIDGQGAGGYYRVIAGPTGTWDSNCTNGGFQTFYVQTKTSQGQWELNAEITLGHIDTLQYSETSTVISDINGRDNAVIGYVAPTEAGCWGEHVHIQVYNYEDYARVFDWDGPSNAADTSLSGPCSRSGGNSSDCNTDVAANEGVGYLGGANTSTTEPNNPYFPDF